MSESYSDVYSDEYFDTYGVPAPGISDDTAYVFVGVPTPVVTVDEPNNAVVMLQPIVIGVVVNLVGSSLLQLPVPGTLPDLPVNTVRWDLYRSPWIEQSRGQLLTKASNKTVSFSLLDPCTVSFSIDGEHPEAALIDELVDDIHVYRNNRFMYRGRVIASTDDVSETAHTVGFSSIDYKGLLYRRLLALTVDTLSTSTPTEQTQLAWRFVNEAQAVLGGDMGIIAGLLVATGVLRADVWQAGMSVGEAVDEMSKRDYGFDWSVDEAKRFNIHYPARGSVRSFAAVYGGNVRSFSRNLDPSEFANSIFSTSTDTAGATITAKTSVEDVGTVPEGRWERLDSSTAQSGAELLLRSQGVLAASAALTPSYTLTLLPGMWTPEDCWVGDSIKTVIRKGRLNVDAYYRVQTIQITTKDDGGEEVVLTVGQPIMSTVNRLWFYGRRLTELERR